MLFNYSTHDNMVTTELNLVPDKNDIVLNLTEEYNIFKKMYKDFLKQFYSITIEEEINKKTFIELISYLKNSNGISLSLNECEYIITDVFYSNTDYENIIFDFEDTLYVNLETFLETFQIKFKQYNFIDYIIYNSSKIKVLVTKGD